MSDANEPEPAEPTSLSQMPLPAESTSLLGVPLPANLTQDDPGLLVDATGGSSGGV